MFIESFSLVTFSVDCFRESCLKLFHKISPNSIIKLVIAYISTNRAAKNHVWFFQKHKVTCSTSLNLGICLRFSDRLFLAVSKFSCYLFPWDCSKFSLICIRRMFDWNISFSKKKNNLKNSIVSLSQRQVKFGTGWFLSNNLCASML